MQRNFFAEFLMLFFCIIIACTKAPIEDPFILSNSLRIRQVERQDHNACAFLKLSFDQTDNVKSALYWRCRLSFAKYRLYTEISTPEQEEHNKEISDLITKISLKVSETPEAVLANENKKMDNRQHRQCLAMGFEIETDDQAKIDDYFACRKALIEDQQLMPPYANDEYLDYPNRSYNIGFVIDQKIEERIKIYNEARKKYPICVKFNLYDVNFKRCTVAQDESRQCFSEIGLKKFKREGEEKIACQKQAYIRFPDEMLKDESKKKAEIERMKANSDYYNQYSFASIGINDTGIFESDEKRAEREKMEKQQKNENINSKKGLYSKYELTQLRQKYIFSCQKEAESKINEYVDSLKNQCQELVNFEIVGE